MTKKARLLILTFLAIMNSGFSQQEEKPLPLAFPGQDTISFWDIPMLKRAYVNSTPVDRKDGILLGELGVDAGERESIMELVNEIAFDKQGMINSLLIAQQGKLLFESYYRKGRIDLPHPQASATKAYTSMAVGRAIQLGYLSMEDLHQPILSFFKEMDQAKFADGVEHITLHKLLSMRSGIRISEEEREEMTKDPSQLKGIKELQLHLEKTATITTDSQTFKYSGDPSLVMQVLEAVVPNGAKNFIETELLDKLGIENYKWNTAPSGLPEAGWRVRMTSRDMLKWGLLIANKGKWGAEQLIAEAYVKQATSRVLYTRDVELHYGGKDVMNQGYGYYFWNSDLKVGNRTYFCYSAQGGGGQFIVFVEELDLIIVFTAYDNRVNYLQIVAERILPAFLAEQ